MSVSPLQGKLDQGRTDVQQASGICTSASNTGVRHQTCRRAADLEGFFGSHKVSYSGLGADTLY